MQPPPKGWARVTRCSGKVDARLCVAPADHAGGCTLTPVAGHYITGAECLLVNVAERNAAARSEK